MEKLADISTFNRLCGVVTNTCADNMYADIIKFYEDNYAITGTPYGTITPKNALTPNGKLLLGQQAIYIALLRNQKAWTNYQARLKEYHNASKVFKNMWASALKHGQCNEEMQKLRDHITDFDASINHFTQELRHNFIYA